MRGRRGLKAGKRRRGGASDNPGAGAEAAAAAAGAVRRQEALCGAAAQLVREEHRGKGSVSRDVAVRVRKGLLRHLSVALKYKAAEDKVHVEKMIIFL